MTKPEPEFLSDYLLREAERFLIYPNRIRRSGANLGAQEIIDRLGRKLMEWRRTSTPLDKADLQLLAEPGLLDEVFCRDLLKSVPGIVARTLALRDLTMPGAAEPDAVAYLREAANCHIQDLPQAAIALSRSAVEAQVGARARRFWELRPSAKST